jgi:caffeoyl-CoA O-methyltransferase
MANADRFLKLNRELYDYVLEHGHNRDPLLRELEEETRKLGPIAAMQVAPEQGTLLKILVRAIGVKSAIEIGTFTGYSSICIARGLAPGGRLLCLDTSEQWTSIARRYWERAGVADRITLKLAPAAETLRALPASTSFDFAFIDADKPNYDFYYEEVLKRLRPGGLVLLDNVVWSGQVINSADKSESTEAIRKINDLIAADNRVEAVMIAISDGITIACKK